MEILPEAIVVLGKGFGFVKTPQPKNEMLRLDARVVTNNIAAASRIVEMDRTKAAIPTDTNYLSSLKVEDDPKLTKDPMANVVIARIHQSINHINLHSQKQSKPNLTPIESQGYNWLLKKTSNLDIVGHTTKG